MKENAVLLWMAHASHRTFGGGAHQSAPALSRYRRTRVRGRVKPKAHVETQVRPPRAQAGWSRRCAHSARKRGPPAAAHASLLHPPWSRRNPSAEREPELRNRGRETASTASEPIAIGSSTGFEARAVSVAFRAEIVSAAVRFPVRKPRSRGSRAQGRSSVQISHSRLEPETGLPSRALGAPGLPGSTQARAYARGGLPWARQEHTVSRGCCSGDSSSAAPSPSHASWHQVRRTPRRPELTRRTSRTR